MDTPHLCNSLVKDLRPVQPVCPRHMAKKWLLKSLVYMALVIPFVARQEQCHIYLTSPRLMVETGILVGLGVAVTLAAFRLAVPGLSVGVWHKRLIVTLGGLWLGALVAWMVREPDTMALTSSGFWPGWMCARDTLFLSLVPVGLFVPDIRKFHPTSPRKVALLMGFASAASASVIMQIHCPAGDPLHRLVWHALPTFLASGLTTLLWFLIVPSKAPLALAEKTSGTSQG